MWQSVDDFTQVHSQTGHKVEKDVIRGKFIYKVYAPDGQVIGSTRDRMEVPAIIKNAKSPQDQACHEWIALYTKRDNQLNEGY